VDGAEYSFYAGIAALAWMIDRTLLQLAYQLDQFRWWLVQVAFTTAYQQLTQFISPLYVPITTVALTIACLLFMLIPFTGRALLNIRQVILWAILTPLLITVSGQLVAQTETIRISIGASLFTEASAAAPGALFGVGATDMADPQPLYPANPCGTGQLQRQTDPGQLHMDDLAAALLYANAGDIHCPDRQGPGFNLPDRFYDADPGFATAQYVSEMVTANDRRAAVDGMKDGSIRLWLGILPCILAICEMLVHLVFALSLAVVWISLPLGLIFISFQSSAAGIASLLRRIFVVLQVSWSSSFVMGLLFAALLAAANLGNAAAYVGFSIAGIVLTGYLASIAFGTLKDSFSVVSSVVESGTGLALQPAVSVIRTATTETLAAAAIGAMAGRTGNAAYAASAVLGRVPGMMELGEVATGMGWMRDDDDAYRGLRAGFDSQRSWRWARQTIDRDDATFAEERQGRQAPAPHAAARSGATSSADAGGQTSTGAPPPSTPVPSARVDTTTNLTPEITILAPVAAAPVMRRGETETIIVEGEIVDRPAPNVPLALPYQQRQLAAPVETMDTSLNAAGSSTDAPERSDGDRESDGSTPDQQQSKDVSTPPAQQEPMLTTIWSDITVDLEQPIDVDYLAVAASDPTIELIPPDTSIAAQQPSEADSELSGSSTTPDGQQTPDADSAAVNSAADALRSAADDVRAAVHDLANQGTPNLDTAETLEHDVREHAEHQPPTEIVAPEPGTPIPAPSSPTTETMARDPGMPSAAPSPSVTVETTSSVPGVPTLAPAPSSPATTVSPAPQPQSTEQERDA